MGEGRWKMKSGKRGNGGRTLEGRDPLIRIDSLLFYNSRSLLKLFAYKMITVMNKSRQRQGQEQKERKNNIKGTTRKKRKKKP